MKYHSEQKRNTVKFSYKVLTIQRPLHVRPNWCIPWTKYHRHSRGIITPHLDSDAIPRVLPLALLPLHETAVQTVRDSSQSQEGIEK